MKRVEINGARLTTEESVHDALTCALELPEWYGRNLDALHDCLTQLRDVELVLVGWPASDYLVRVRRVMLDAIWENDSLKLTIID